MMLAIGKQHFATLYQAKPPEEMKLVQQPSINGQKSSVAATLRQALVKTEVKSVVPIEIFSFRRVIHRFHQPLKFLDLYTGKLARCTPGRKFLQCRVNVMDFNRLLEINLAYVGSTILFDLEETNICQRAKSLSDRTAADIEAFGDLLFGELLTGSQFASENPFRDR